MAKILIADDHIVLREGLRSLLDTFEQWNVVAEASNGFEVLDLVEEHEPDIVILDLTMPKRDGISTYDEISDQSPDLPVILCSGFSQSEVASRIAADSSRLRFVSKPFTAKTLLAAVFELVGPTVNSL